MHFPGGHYDSAEESLLWKGNTNKGCLSRKHTGDSVVCQFFSPPPPQKEHKRTRIDFILQKLKIPLGRDFLLAALMVYTF